MAAATTTPEHSFLHSTLQIPSSRSPRHSPDSPSMSARSVEQQQQQQQIPHPHLLSPYQTLRNNFGAGAIALSTSFAVMHPLDTLKTRMQAASKSTSHSNLTIKSFFTRDTLKTLRRGFTTSVLGAAAQGGLRWMTFDACKTELCARFPEKVPETTGGTGTGTTADGTRRKKNILPSASFMLTSAASAIAGDLASSIVKVPREVVTARLQTGHYDTPPSHSHSVQGVSKPKGATYAIRTILRSEGVPGLFRGFWSLTLRDWPFMIILFTTYDTLKSVHHNFAINNAPPADIADGTAVYTHEIPTLKSTLFGGLAGGLAAFVTTPFDVIRARIMTFKAAPGTAAGATPNMRQISGMILREHVAKTTSSSAAATTTIATTTPTPRTAISMIPAASRAFFVGAAPRTVWWFCVCSMFFPIVERCKEGFDALSV
ncbi:mitochondrial carrier domain-containing protein [Fimicolochytrium jonesii]|uniref:mitochondrial carrier domain-containing protein n=1 Tax=Fimicolochytrium jonesii TaxID=1396493 RepID=UPI0022FF3784|nr:mitochondrial carrier domain-containing protein [Fimicolochytrium jonesii]KAI8826182.1 mitochondrial carrier domain-containing protein [Fimicolochytrium jonesii]